MRAMSVPPREKRPGAYEHRFHAGNAADVFKHTALVAALERVLEADGAVRYVETHAGAGRYHLGPDGEWRDGIGRLLTSLDDAAPAAVARYTTLLDARPSRKGVRYLGSPLLAARLVEELGGVARSGVLAYELDPEAASHLEAALARHAFARVVVGDGVHALANGLPEVAPDAAPFVLVDPPWVEKAEWTKVPDALVAASERRPNARFALWYPVKSLTRPNAMFARLAERGLAATVVELSPSPTAVSRGRLVGSGLVLVRPPGGLVEELARLAAWLGPRLATTEGAWSVRVVSWAARGAAPDGRGE